MDIVCDVLIETNKFFNQYINISLGMETNDSRIIRIDPNLPKICESINGTYISLVDIPNKKVSIAQNDFLIRKKLLKNP